MLGGTRLYCIVYPISWSVIAVQGSPDSKSHLMRLPLLALLGLATCCCLRGQDALRQHYRGNESFFNPALTGQTAASRLTFGLRSQWGAAAAATGGPNAYAGRYLVYEEALPCLFFDYGLFASHDEAGSGQLRSSEFGGRVAVALPVFRQRPHALTNLRIGLGLAQGQRSVDYGGLVFLDQLDNIGGRTGSGGQPLPSVFHPAGPLTSPWYTATSLGVSLSRAVRQRGAGTADRPLTYDVGLAVHNWTGLTSRDGRQSKSLAGLDVGLEERWVLSGTANVVVAKRNRRYWSLHPLLIVQRQSGLHYLEVGTGVSWHRNLEIGLYHHLAELGGNGANWTSLRTAFGDVLPGGYTRMDLGLSWSFQHGYLKNYVRAPLELTATFSFGRSLGCLAAGRPDDLTKIEGGRVRCYNFATSGRRIYHNIWP